VTGGRLSRGPRRPARIPQVTQRVDDVDKYHVDLDVAPAVNLRALARTIRQDPHAAWCWRVLTLNESGKGLIETAMTDLRAMAGNGLTIELSVEDAAAVLGGLVEAVEPPMQCARQGCEHYASGAPGPDGDVCIEHVTPDEYDEFERLRKH
jgi:hypothetical protein